MERKSGRDHFTVKGKYFNDIPHDEVGKYGMILAKFVFNGEEPVMDNDLDKVWWSWVRKDIVKTLIVEDRLDKEEKDISEVNTYSNDETGLIYIEQSNGELAPRDIIKIEPEQVNGLIENLEKEVKKSK